MAKVALLIGVSECGQGLTSLPGTQADIQAMQRVLQNPQIGGFDDVQTLPNPDPTQMQMAIETLFSDNRQRDDLVLLYFSGHGIRDNSGTLHFSTRITTTNTQGGIRTSTAVPASALQSYMGQSRSKRQVLILDCCFSGAFANDMKAKADEAIDLKALLGSEGRAVLTSSTATQVSYERDGASIYTRYLVQGLETGAADRDEDGHIDVDELHQYAKEKVQDAAPTMQPEIYVVREGYKIILARAPQGDPKLVFRKEVEGRAKPKRGKLSPIDQRALKFRGQELGLSAPELEQITAEILQPYQAFWAKLAEFEQAVKETLDYDPQLSAASLDDLRYFQRVLKLRDEDIASILPSTVGAGLDEKRSQPTQNPQQKLPLPAAPQPGDDIALESEKGIDYTKLRDLLKAGKWKEADNETYLRMLEVVGRKGGDYIRAKELETFPCKDLKTIDHLWVTYSKGHFGFSVQKKIWQDCGSPTSPGKDWDRFCVRVGWQNKDATAYVSYSDLQFNPKNSPVGELPRRGFEGVVVLLWGVSGFGVGCLEFSSLAQRLVNCSIAES